MSPRFVYINSDERNRAPAESKQVNKLETLNISYGFVLLISRGCLTYVLLKIYFFLALLM